MSSTTSSVLCLAAAVALATTACSSGDDTAATDDVTTSPTASALPSSDETADASAEPSPPATTSPAEATPETYGSLRHLVPDDLSESTLILAIPPEEMRSELYLRKEDGTITGPLPDLVRAAADLLGLPTDERPFSGGDELRESYIDDQPAVFLIAASPWGFPVDDADVVTFAEYDEMFLLREGLEIGDEPTDLCGLRVGQYHPEHSQPDLGGYFAEVSAACDAAGNPMEIVPFEPDDGVPTDAVAAGEIDAAPAGEINGARLVNEKPGLTLGGHVTGQDATAFISGKQHGLAEPLAEALEELSANGTYARIMDSYGLPDVAPSEPTVNVVER